MYTIHAIIEARIILIHFNHKLNLDQTSIQILLKHF